MQEYYGTKRIQAEPYPGGNPLQDGYKVVYEDGYTSWSPKEVFEKAYQPVTAMGFHHALKAMMDGNTVKREGWTAFYISIENGKIFAIINRDDPSSKGPYYPTSSDMLANDWRII